MRLFHLSAFQQGLADTDLIDLLNNLKFGFIHAFKKHFGVIHLAVSIGNGGKVQRGLL